MHPRSRVRIATAPRAGDRSRRRDLRGRLAAEDGAAVAEFPMVAVLIVMIALLIIQAALIMHTRNTLVDAAVQGAHHAALVGATPQDGADRAEQLLGARFGEALAAEAVATEAEDGTITVRIDARLPLIGLFGPSGTLSVEGHALDEEAW